MAWNGREGNQKKKIVKNGTRWGQILCSGKKTALLLRLGRKGNGCMCVDMFVTPMEEMVFVCLFIFFGGGGFACLLFVF